MRRDHVGGAGRGLPAATGGGGDRPGAHAAAAGAGGEGAAGRRLCGGELRGGDDLLGLRLDHEQRHDDPEHVCADREPEVEQLVRRGAGGEAAVDADRHHVLAAGQDLRPDEHHRAPELRRQRHDGQRRAVRRAGVVRNVREEAERRHDVELGAEDDVRHRDRVLRQPVRPHRAPAVGAVVQLLVVVVHQRQAAVAPGQPVHRDVDDGAVGQVPVGAAPVGVRQRGVVAGDEGGGRRKGGAGEHRLVRPVRLPHARVEAAQRDGTERAVVV